ncbi:retrovirus-related pol polyprotein from transposon tnt 1-94 [Phtheirospermum japonicum]|uniref:Retrovirus-related pol polyprotein from transposon tnt 1-94 n=1 Tax=Phtheirospermum japonicum TaxID=374723 RepID=A0A830BQV8_9LAMI|nr:retrovirus-related pol polyprotein from transposon tnt 1-94 [Phtheirospermum japonicum]
MDLMGPLEVESLGGKRYVLMIVDDFSCFTWVEFLKEKYEAFKAFKNLAKKLCVRFGVSIGRIRSDHGKEFENASFSKYCSKVGVSCPDCDHGEATFTQVQTRSADEPMTIVLVSACVVNFSAGNVKNASRIVLVKIDSSSYTF